MSLRDQIEAYGKWRAAALKASGDVESQHLAEQRVILHNRATVAGLGEEYERAMGRAETATRKTGAAVREETNSMAAGFSRVAAAADRASLSILQSTQYDKQGFALGADGQRVTAGGQLKIPDGYYFDAEAANKNPMFRAGRTTGGEFIKPTAETAARMAADEQARFDSLDLSKANGAAGVPRLGVPTAVAPSAPAAVPSAGRTVTINIAGMGSTSVRLASDADAAKVEGMLRQLETAMARASSAMV